MEKKEKKKPSSPVAYIAFRNSAELAAEHGLSSSITTQPASSPPPPSHPHPPGENLPHIPLPPVEAGHHELLQRVHAVRQVRHQLLHLRLDLAPPPHVLLQGGEVLQPVPGSAAAAAGGRRGERASPPSSPTATKTLAQGFLSSSVPNPWTYIRTHACAYVCKGRAMSSKRGKGAGLPLLP